MIQHGRKNTSNFSFLTAKSNDLVLLCTVFNSKMDGLNHFPTIVQHKSFEILLNQVFFYETANTYGTKPLVFIMLNGNFRHNMTHVTHRKDV